MRLRRLQGDIEEETLAIHRGGRAMGTKLERISQQSRKNFNLINSIVKNPDYVVEWNYENERKDRWGY